MAQQTAVQMLLEYINKHGFDMEYEMEMSFLEHEKEQIIKAANFLPYDEQNVIKSGEDYYNENYNK